MDAKQELEALKAAVRKLSGNPELLRLVGPSDDEQAQAEARLQRLDKLSRLCAWDKMAYCLTNIQRLARERWGRIMDAQQTHEARYC